jgi:hypothetical protein
MTTNTSEEALARFINGTLDAADKVGQFAVAELPQFITEALHWYFAYNLILFVAGVALAIFAIVVDVKLFKSALKTESYDVMFGAYGILGMIPRTIVWVPVFVMVNLQWLKIWIAPKLWLIEYAARLLK